MAYIALEVKPSHNQNHNPVKENTVSTVSAQSHGAFVVVPHEPMCLEQTQNNAGGGVYKGKQFFIQQRAKQCI